MPSMRTLHSDRLKDPFVDTLIAPYEGYQPLPGPSTLTTQTQRSLTRLTVATEEPTIFSCLNSPTTQPQQREPAPSNPALFQPIYRTFGEWAWMNDLPIRDARLLSVLDSKDGYELGIKSGTAGERAITYLCKTSTFQRPWPGFLPEVVLFKQQLRHLQGVVVPTLIQISKNDFGRTSLVMAPPHSCFWIQASADMPEVLKERCVDAVQQLHNAGVMHGELLPSNVWLGGDGKVTIINFHKSRAIAPCPRLGLFSATTEDLEMEMRKFKWQIDYRAIRIQEDTRFSRAMKRSRRNQHERKKAFLSPGYRPVIEEIPEEDIATPPLNPTACIMQWLPRERTVTRFIMPDQTPEQFISALRGFLQHLEALKLAQRRPQDASLDQSSEEPSDSRLTAISGSILSSIEKAWSSSGLARLCKKRGRYPSADTEGGARKRIRFVGVPENEVDEDSPLPPLDGSSPDVDIPFSSADDPSGVTTFLKIVEANIAQCAKLGLPHPDAIEQDPGNPRWLDPNVTEYLKKQERDRIQIEQAKLYFQGNRIAPPRILRSAGRIQRTLRAIAHPSSLLEPMTPGPSRKRHRDENLDTLFADSQPPKKKVRRSASPLDSINNIAPQHHVIANSRPSQPKSIRSTTLKRIQEKSGPRYQLRLRVKRVRRMEREPPVPLSSVRVDESGPTALSSGPRPPFSEVSISPSISQQVSAGDVACGTPVFGDGGVYLPSSVVSRWLGSLCRLVLES